MNADSRGSEVAKAVSREAALTLPQAAAPAYEQQLERDPRWALSEGSKHPRDTELGVRIELLTTGDYPGDGKPKPVAFPEPAAVSFESGGIRYIQLPSLIELKLASGMTNPGRLRDLSDVLELVKILKLTPDFAAGLNPFVRDKFRELCVAAEESERSGPSDSWAGDQGDEAVSD